MNLDNLASNEVIIYLANLADDRIYPYPSDFINYLGMIACFQLLAAILGVFEKCRTSRSYNIYLIFTILVLPVFLMVGNLKDISVVSVIPVLYFSLIQIGILCFSIKFKEKIGFAKYFLLLTLILPFFLLALGGYMVDVVYPT